MARKPLSEMIAEAKAAIEELSVEQLQAEIDAGTCTVIDIRDVRELWDKARFPGRNPSRGMLEFWFDPESPYYRGDVSFDERYVLHCAGGQRSALAAKVLQDLGYTNVAHPRGRLQRLGRAGGAVDEVHLNPKYFQR
ncbi:MAG: rhodanese-like domain-containing protein [Ilumatobacteraceae bacterium]